MTLESLIIVGKKYPMVDLDELTHPAQYFADLQIRKARNKNEFLLLKQKGKYYEVIFAYNPNGYKR